MPHSTTCSLLLRRCVARSSSSAASGAGAKRHISCLLRPRTRPTRRCFSVVAATSTRHTPPRAVCRRYLATIQSGSEFGSAGAGAGDASAAATSTTGADSASASGADSSSFHGMSLRDIDFLVEEFESCSTVEGLAKYLGDPSSLRGFSLELYDVIDVCASRRNSKAARIAERALGHWIYLSSVAVAQTDSTRDASALQLPPPTRDAFNSTMCAWADARARSGYGARRAQEIMNLMLSMPPSEETETTPNIGTYTALLQAWAKSGERSAPNKLLGILKDLEIKSGIAPLLDNGTEQQGQLLTADDLSNLNLALIPDRVCYNMACLAWSKSTNPEAPKRIRQLMSKMESMAKALGVNEYRPNTRTWNMLIHSYARLGQDQKGRRDKRRERRPPSRQSDKAEDYAQAAETTLREMHALHLEQVQSGRVAIQPEDDEYGEIDINADNNIRPDIMSYNGILNAWSNLRGTDRAPKRAEEILNLLLESAASRGEGSAPRSNWNSDLPVVPGVEPNIVTYTTLIKCWARSGSLEAGERAEAMLSFMNGKIGRNYLFNPISRAARWQSEVVRPNVMTWNATMDCWSKSGAPNGAFRAEKLLLMMLDNPPGADGPIHPNAISFATVIHAWSKSSAEDRAKKAAALLDRMKELCHSAGDHSLKPTSACFAGVIFAHVGVGNIVAADDILREMREEEGITPPTSYSNAVLEGYSKAYPIIHINQEGGTRNTVLPVSRARAIFEDMIAMGAENKVSAPDAVSFQHLLATCSSCAKDPTMRKEGLHVAFSILDELRATRCLPIGSSTYVDMFELLSKLAPKRGKGRPDVYRRLFESCCEDGLLDQHLLHLLTRAVPGKDLRDILGLDGIASMSSKDLMSLNLNDLPAQWSNGKRSPIRQSQRDKELAGSSKPQDSTKHQVKMRKGSNVKMPRASFLAALPAYLRAEILTNVQNAERLGQPDTEGQSRDSIKQGVQNADPNDANYEDTIPLEKIAVANVERAVMPRAPGALFS